jgi:hypothetical protein
MVPLVGLAAQEGRGHTIWSRRETTCTKPLTAVLRVLLGRSRRVYHPRVAVPHLLDDHLSRSLSGATTILDTIRFLLPSLLLPYQPEPHCVLLVFLTQAFSGGSRCPFGQLQRRVMSCSECGKLMGEEGIVVVSPSQKKRAVSGSIITALGNKYHESCFRCGICRSELAGSFYGCEGRPYCDKCIDEAVR